MTEIERINAGTTMIVFAWFAVMAYVWLRDRAGTGAKLGIEARETLAFRGDFPVPPLWILLPLIGGPSTAMNWPLFAVIASLFLWVCLRQWRQRKRRPPLPLSRGLLDDSIGRMAAAFALRMPRCSILLADYETDDDTYTPAVMVRKRLLDWLSRAEIDALAARQLAYQQRAYVFPVRACALGCGGIAVAASELLGASLPERALITLATVVVAVAALALWLPHAGRNADLRAIELVGNPEALFSALGKLAWLSIGPLDAHGLEPLARKAGVTPERLRALLEPRLAPEEDRYPTVGDYMTVGF